MKICKKQKPICEIIPEEIKKALDLIIEIIIADIQAKNKKKNKEPLS